MTPELRQYLTEWYEWATGGAVDGGPFRRFAGLCYGAPEAVVHELRHLLTADLGTCDYPFGGYDDYLNRITHKTQHLCPKRLAWVAGKIGRAA